MPAKSRNSAVTAIKKAYAGAGDRASLPNAGLFTAFGKNSTNPTDKNYIANIVSLLYGYGFITKDYGVINGSRERTGITLTDEGRQALGEEGSQSKRKPKVSDEVVTLPQIEAFHLRWEKQNEGWKLPTPAPYKPTEEKPMG